MGLYPTKYKYFIQNHLYNNITQSHKLIMKPYQVLAMATRRISLNLPKRYWSRPIFSGTNFLRDEISRDEFSKYRSRQTNVSFYCLLSIFPSNRTLYTVADRHMKSWLILSCMSVSIYSVPKHISIDMARIRYRELYLKARKIC